MKRLLICLMVLMFAVPVLALTGADDPLIDVPAVQAAVDAGGIVSLSSIFDFGDLSVEIGRNGNNVQIVGEPGAKINNGEPAFYCDNPNVNLKISELELEGAKGSAIWIRQCAKADIIKNNIINVETAPYAVEWFGPPTPPGDPGPIIQWPNATGIKIGGDGLSYIESIEPRVYGDVKDIYCREVNILENEIDKIPAIDNHNCTATGIMAANCNVQAQIKKNTVTNTYRGIVAIDLYGLVNIAENSLTSSQYTGGSPRFSSPASWGISIIAGAFNKKATEGKYHVLNNTITARSTEPAYSAGAIGIMGSVNNAIISQNTIELQEGSGYGIFGLYIPGYPFYWGTDAVPPGNNLIAKNIISGEITWISQQSPYASTAIALVDFDDNVLTENVINVTLPGLPSPYPPILPTALLNSDRNTVVGLPPDEVFDAGIDNKIVGVPARKK